MKIFRFWMNLPLSTAWRAHYELIPVTEITDKTANFNEKVEAIKASGCSWIMLTRTEETVESSADKPKVELSCTT